MLHIVLSVNMLYDIVLSHTVEAVLLITDKKYSDLNKLDIQSMH